MTLNLSGLGMYPTDACYDGSRPSWLPYWIDDSVESACKYNSDSLIGQMGGVVGSATGAVASATGDLLAGAASNAASQLNLNGYLVVGAVALAAYFLLKK